MNKIKAVLKNIKSDSNGNYLYCHYGLRQVLGMLYDAAGGLTKAELVDWKLENNDEIKAPLLSGNLLLINQNLGKKINCEYEKLLQTKYNAKSIFYDESNLKVIVKEANDFIEEHTGGNIKNAVTEEKVEANDFIATNSVYFYSKWSQKLEESDDILFTNNKNDKKEVKSVKGIAKKYISNEYIHGFSYAYADKRYSFMALMSKDKDNGICWQDIPDLDDIRLAYKNDNVIWACGKSIKTAGLELANMDVYFTMPKLKMDADDIRLDDALKEMGIKNIYGLNADLSQGFSSKAGLYLKSISQKTGIIVDENGTEGWGFTEARAVKSIIEKVELIFNKPYFFMVYDEVDKQPVFAGIINEPQWK